MAPPSDASPSDASPPLPDASASGPALDVAALLDGDLRSALRLLECSDPARPRLGQAVRVADEVVRISQSVSLAFERTSLVTLERGDGARPWRLTCRQPGLFGHAGPLPLHFTEEADRRARHHGDASTREFIDLFNHRLLALFYRAWADGEPAIACDRPADNPLAAVIGAIGGFGESASRGRSALPDTIALGSASWFGRQARSPDGLVALLERHLGLAARVEELDGGWVPLPSASRLVLRSHGRERVLLGRRILGRRGWCADGAFRLVVRLAGAAALDALTRPGKALDTLDEVVRTYVGDELAWTLELALPARAARPVSLDRRTRLARDSWLHRPSSARAGTCRLRLDPARRLRVRRPPSPTQETAR
mgnify:CR=1 FL=1